MSRQYMRQYTPEEKIAYYKSMAKANKGGYIAGRGSYVKKQYPSKQVKRSYVKKQPNELAKLGDLGAPAGSAIGSVLGGPVGGLIGGGLGTLAGGLFKHFVGKGDYVAVNNCFLKNGEMCEPIINPHYSGGQVFRKTEYLCDIISSSSANTFQNQSFSVNPGLESTFQWLSQVAANYEEYVIEGMYFEFRSMSSDALNSTNTALGQVIMAAQYNAALPNFTNKQSLENYDGGCSCKPSESMRYFVECAKNKSVLDNLYIRQGSVPLGQDQRLYDLCNFQIATNGVQGTSVNLGELWVTYQVCLRKPKLFAALGLYNDWVTVTPTNGTFTNLLPLGDQGTWNIGVTSNLVGFSITSTSFSFSPPSLPQSYMVYIEWIGGSVTCTYPSLTSSNGVTMHSINRSPPASSVTTTCSYQFFMTYRQQDNSINGNPTITLSTTGTLPSASGQALNFYIVQVPNTVYNV